MVELTFFSAEVIKSRLNVTDVICLIILTPANSYQLLEYRRPLATNTGEILLSAAAPSAVTCSECHVSTFCSPKDGGTGLGGCGCFLVAVGWGKYN